MDTGTKTSVFGLALTSLDILLPHLLAVQLQVFVRPQ
jgi:hypothetical protein